MAKYTIQKINAPICFIFIGISIFPQLIFVNVYMANMLMAIYFSTHSIKNLSLAAVNILSIPRYNVAELLKVSSPIANFPAVNIFIP